ncbi:MAG: biotin synthase BioB [Chlamydiia bacterium]|nr:biotin synthase BioB [Chlamydiia bacterium]
MKVQSDWTLREIKNLYEMPLVKLIARAMGVHAEHHEVGEVQVCHLISIKTGGCLEDCKYCAQSSHYKTSVKPQPMMRYEETLSRAKEAVARGATRVCLGAAWTEVRENKQFEDTLRMVKGIAELGVEVCCTLGFINASQAGRLKEAGLYAYNHNLDTSEAFYKTIITTRSYQDRLKTLDVVEEAGLSVCCGGILGMGESIEDRLKLIHTLSNRDPHPESVPINKLSRIEGTPLEDQPLLPFWEMVRIIAIARITMPKTMVRLSAGRIELSPSEQALCFLAGANSIFSGEKLLTVANTPVDRDCELFEQLGLKKRRAFANESLA